jgi:hypothetical protein
VCAFSIPTGTLRRSKHMKNSLVKLVIGVAAVAAVCQAKAAISLSLQPSSQTINVGNSAAVDLVVSGLGNLTAPSLGGFAVDLSFDPSILSGLSASFGTQLDLGVAGSVQFSDLSTPGLIHLDEVSLELAADLNAAQPGSFILGTLNLTGVGGGLGALNFTSASLSDEEGQSLSFTTSGGEIQVNGPSRVPDAGSTAALLLLGMLGLALPRVHSLRRELSFAMA